MSSLLEYALQYASRGWPVFPCHEAGKLPLTPHGFKDATTDHATIREWWSRWPKANIGVPTGRASGFVVVDVDGERGRESLQRLLDDHTSDGCMPQTLASTTGRGTHYLFAAGDEPIRNSTDKLGPAIDTRGDGGYIIVPPSVHPSGAIYEWASHGAELPPPAPLPDWLRPATQTPQAAAPKRIIHQHHATDKLRRASAYLATMEPAIMGAGGHDRLYAAATAMVHGFDLSRSEARALLEAEYNPRCVPPWNLADHREARDFARKIDQAATQPHDQPRGWLLAQELDAIAFGGGSAEHGARVAAILTAAPVQVATANPPTLPAEARGPAEAAQPPARGDFPAWLLQPPGYIGELCAWINATAFKLQPMLALANALAFFGTLVGRKVADPMDLRTNLYCLGVGESGCGKDHSRKAIKKLCAAAGLTDKLLGGEDVTSDVAIVKAAQQNPSILFQFDEIGHMIASAHSRQAATYQRAIPVTLTKLYSSSNTVYLGKEYAGDADRQDIEQPNVCVYGTTVPSRLYEGITPAEIRDGFMGRMLVFQTHDDDPEPTDAPAQPPTQSLVVGAQEWYQRRIEPPAGTGSLDAAMRPWQIRVPYTADAQQRFLQLRHEAREQRKAVAREAPGLDSLWSRAEENARKVALAVAAGCEYHQPAIDGQVADYACSLVAELVRRLVDQIRDHVTDSEVGRQINAIKAAIRAAGGAATKSQITRMTQHKMRARERTEVLATLVESGEVVAETVQSGRVGGAPKSVFRIK